MALLEAVSSIGLDVISSILAEYARRVVDKAVRGEKLSDWEVGFLLMEAVRRSTEARMEALEKSLNARIDAVEARLGALEKRVEALESRVSSLEAEVRSIRSSIDPLRDTVITKLLEKVF